MNNPIYVDIEQGTPEWEEARLGIPTASQFDRIVTADGKPSKQRTKYLYELAAEIKKQQKESTYQSWEMREGTANEPQGRAEYSLLHGVSVQTIGLVYYDERRDRSCSPDGLIDDDGGLELKWASKGSIQVDRLFNGWDGASAHHRQVQGCLYVTGRKWWDLVSYHKGLDPVRIRIERDEKFIEALDQELNKFLAELVSITDKLRNR